MMLKVAITFVACVIVTVQVAAPEQAPDHPMKVESAEGVAIRVTEVSKVKLADWFEQPTPQSMPAGLLITVPEPIPTLETVITAVGTWLHSGAS